jgi:hypothetical protein
MVAEGAKLRITGPTFISYFRHADRFGAQCNVMIQRATLSDPCLRPSPKSRKPLQNVGPIRGDVGISSRLHECARAVDVPPQNPSIPDRQYTSHSSAPSSASAVAIPEAHTPWGRDMWPSCGSGANTLVSRAGHG